MINGLTTMKPRLLKLICKHSRYELRFTILFLLPFKRPLEKHLYLKLYHGHNQQPTLLNFPIVILYLYINKSQRKEMNPDNFYSMVQLRDPDPKSSNVPRV